MNATATLTRSRHAPVRVGAHPLLRVVLRMSGVGLLVATALTHLHLYRSGYSGIPTIGALFLGNVVGGFVLATAVLVTPGRLGRLAALGGALFEAGTLVGLVVTVTHGLFGFQDTSSAPDFTASIVVESLGAVVLLALALLPGSKPAAGR